MVVVSCTMFKVVVSGRLRSCPTLRGGDVLSEWCGATAGRRRFVPADPNTFATPSPLIKVARGLLRIMYSSCVQKSWR